MLTQSKEERQRRRPVPPEPSRPMGVGVEISVAISTGKTHRHHCRYLCDRPLERDERTQLADIFNLFDSADLIDQGLGSGIP